MPPALAFLLRFVLTMALWEMAALSCCEAAPSTHTEAGFSTINIEANPHRALSLGLAVTHSSFTPTELDHMVRRQMRRLGEGFNLDRATARVFVPRVTNYLAAVWYSSEKGKPALLCMLDFDGKAISTRFAQTAPDPTALPKVVLGADVPAPAEGIAGPTNKLWTPERVDSVIKTFIANQKLAFDFSGVRFSGLSIPRNRLYLATVWYRHEFGKPSLLCKVGLDGQVIEHHIGIARPD
jgi:hypothetical protein